MAAGPPDPVPPPDPPTSVPPSISLPTSASVPFLSVPPLPNLDPNFSLLSPPEIAPHPPPATSSERPPHPLPPPASDPPPCGVLSSSQSLSKNPPRQPSTIPTSSSLRKSPSQGAPVEQQSLNPLLDTPPVQPSSAPCPLPLGPQIPPLQPPSYAQVTRGTGFVRSHARAVESFARLPRTGVKIISSSKEGMPSFSFANADLPKVEKLYTNALVMKFFGGRPSLEASHREISSWGMDNPFTIGPLNSRAFLLRFQDEKDLLKVLSRPSSNLISFPYRVFRWHNLCHLKEDSCIAPVWITLPRLPLQCFVPEFLESVANRIGRFLCLDKATATLARPSAARVCVELDLRIAPPEFIWIGLFEGFKQQILYERLPKYCSACQSQGHSFVQCSKNSLDNPQIPVVPRFSGKTQRTPVVRQNAAPTQQPPQNPGSSFIHNLRVSSKALNSHSSEIPCQPAPVSSSPLQSGVVSSQAPADPQQASTNHRAPHPLTSQISSKQKESTTLDRTQSNVTANKVFWDAVNRQVSIIEQARLSTPQVDSASSPIPTPTSENLPLRSSALGEPHNPASATLMRRTTSREESDSDSSLGVDSQPNSPGPPCNESHNTHDSNIPATTLSEGEEPTDPLPLLGHNTDDVISLRPQSSKRNKRHPDQPLKVQLRVRKDPTPPSS